jgi:hypothetical protein
VAKRTCAVVESGKVCGAAVVGRGYCSKHHQRWRAHGDPLGFAVRATPEERFYSYVDRSGDCWQWTGSVASHGYGYFGVNYKTVYVHIFAYELLVGPIPEGLKLDHLCRNRSCCNPAHLEPVTNRTNILRGVSPAAQNARMTVCSRGHELSGANLYVSPKGKRQCVECRRLRMRSRKMINGKRVYLGVETVAEG